VSQVRILSGALALTNAGFEEESRPRDDGVLSGALALTNAGFEEESRPRDDGVLSGAPH
jgi:hypothetical protein